MRIKHIPFMILGWFVGQFIGLALQVGVAQADKTVTYLSAGVVMDSMTFRNAGGGNVGADVCAHAKLQGGGDGPSICETFMLPPTDPTAIDVTSLATARGIPAWKTRQGL